MQVKTSEYDADWIGALIVAADFLQSDLGNTKVAHKKIVLMTNLKTCPKVNESDLNAVSIVQYYFFYYLYCIFCNFLHIFPLIGD